MPLRTDIKLIADMSVGLAEPKHRTRE